MVVVVRSVREDGRGWKVVENPLEEAPGNGEWRR